MAQSKITIVVDDEGNAEVRSPASMSDDEVLDILTAAVDATADRILAADQKATAEEKELETPLPNVSRKSKSYMN